MTIERTQENTESESTRVETSDPAPTDTAVEHTTETTERTEVKTGDSDDGA